MIYITGDIHGDPRRFSTDKFKAQTEMTKDDYVIICGDFGMLWSLEESKKENYWLDWLNDKKFTTLFIDGNHENFDRLNSLPVERWRGGNVHFVRNSVIHLMRGEVFDLNGVSLFAFGGARSHDIDGLATEEELKKDYTAGILQKDDPHLYGKLRMASNYCSSARIENRNWWRAEMPTQNEMNNGTRNLELCNKKVDFIVSHDGPMSDLVLLGGRQITADPLNKYFEELRQTVSYKEWFFGHHHQDRRINDKDTAMYHSIIRVD